MPRVRIEQLKEGMIAGTDVRNRDGTLLLPAGCLLTARQIELLRAWGVRRIEVQTSDEGGGRDVFDSLSPEEIAAMSLKLRSRFVRADDSDPVFTELFKVLLRRNANRQGKRN